MKILIISLFLILVLVAVAVTWTRIQINPGDYRPDLERFMEASLGIRVHLGEIKAGWEGTNFLFEIRGLEFKDSAGAVLLRCPIVRADITGLLFFRHQLKIEKIVFLNPQIYLRRMTDGKWNWSHSADSVAASGVIRSAGASNALTINIRDLEFQQGTLYYFDETVSPEFSLTFDKVNLHTPWPQSGTLTKVEGSLAVLDFDKSNMSFSAAFQPATESLLFELLYGDQKITTRGEAAQNGPLQVRMEINAHQLDLASILPNSWKTTEHISGIMTSQASLASLGIHPEELKKALNVDAVVDIRNGSIRNINFIHRVFERLISVPGLENLLTVELPFQFEVLRNGSDTPFERFQTSVKIHEGRIYLGDLQLKHPDYLLEAKGDISLTAPEVDFKANLVLLEPFSETLSEKVEVMGAFQNSQQRIVIPFVWRGNLPAGMVVPDFGYLTTNLIHKQGEEFVQRGLEKLSEIFGQTSGG